MTSPMGQNRDVNVTVNANVDPYVKSMTTANEITLKLADALKKLDERVVSIGKRVGQGVAGAGTAGILGFLGSAREAAQLEKSFEGLSAQTVQTGEKMQLLVRGAKDITREVPIATAQVAQLQSQVKALGIDGVTNINRLTKVSLELSAATQTPPGQLFQGLAELTRSFGNSIQNIERYGSAVTTLSQRMGVNANGITGFANQIQAVSNKAGVAETQVLGLSAAFQRVGADGFAGANAFNTVVNDISDAIATNSSRLNSYANLLGMTREQFAALGKENPTETFVRFIEAVQSSGTRATQVLQQFGLDGVRTQRVFAALTSGQADIRTALGLSSQAYTENVSTANAAAEAWDGASDSFERAANAAKNVATNLGGPLLHIFTPIGDGITDAMTKLEDFLRIYNELPGFFEGSITSFLSKTTGVAAIGGAFIAATFAASKFLGVWRVLSGTLGTNIFAGLRDGLRGIPREMDNVSRTGTQLYQWAYAGGSARRGAGTVGERRQGLVGQVAMLPVRRFEQIGRDAANTAMSPFGGRRRDNSQTDPWSTYGIYQAGERRLRAMRDQMAGSDNDVIRGIGQSLNFDRTGERTKQSIAQERLQFTEEARRRATAEQNRLLFGPASQFGREERIALLSATEAEQQRGNNRYRPTDFASMSAKQRDKQLSNVAIYRGNQAAQRAGELFDAKLSDEDTAKMANPFKKLTDKVGEQMKELTTQTGAATKAAMGDIETFFGQAVQRIKALAQEAKIEMQNVQAAATGQDTVNRMTTMPGVPPVPGSTIRETAKIQAEETAKATTAATAATTANPGGLGAAAMASQVIDALNGDGEDDNSPEARRRQIDEIVNSSVIGISNNRNAPGGPGIPPGQSPQSDNIRDPGRIGQTFRRFGEQLRPATDMALDGVKRLGSGVVSGVRLFSSLASSPIGILTAILLPTLVTGIGSWIDSMKKATSAQEMVGAELTNRLGRDYIDAAQRKQNEADKENPADNDPFGRAEVADARSGEFGADYANLLSSLRNASDGVSRLARVQEEVNALVREQNNGAPLDAAQQAEIRKVLIASLGNVPNAERMYRDIDITGRTNSDFYRTGVDNLYDPDNEDRDRTRDDLISRATQTNDYANLAYVLGQGAMRGGANEENASNVLTAGVNDDYARVGSRDFADLVRQTINDYNTANPDNQIDDVGGLFDNNDPGDDIGSFLDALSRGNDAAVAFGEALRNSGLEVNGQGLLTAAALERLANAADTSADAMVEGTPLATALESNTLAQRYRGMTGDYITGALSNTSGIGYSQAVNQITELAGGGGSILTSGGSDLVQRRIREITELKNVIGDPNDPAYQALDKILGTAYGQLSTATSQMSPARQLAIYVQQLRDIDVSNPLNADLFASSKSSLESMVNNQISAVKGYYLQVRDAYRQLNYGAEDFRRQQGKSARDFNIQMKESYYQRNEQLRQADYSFNEQQRQAAYSYSESLRSMKNSYDEVFGNPAAFVQSQYTQGASSAMIGMDRQVEYLKRQLAGMSQLRNLGVSNDVIKLLGLDDPRNFQQVEKYVTDLMGNPQLVQQFNDTIRERLSLQDALAQDPSNSDLTELNRQFKHSADEAKRAFDYAAAESARAFAHSMETSQQSYDRSMADMVESYRISVSRTYADIARIGEDTTMTTEALLEWASASGIAGIQNMGTAIQEALDAIQVKTNEMLGRTMSGLVDQLRDFFGFGNQRSSFAATAAEQIAGLFGFGDKPLPGLGLPTSTGQGRTSTDGTGGFFVPGVSTGSKKDVNVGANTRPGGGFVIQLRANNDAIEEGSKKLREMESRQKQMEDATEESRKKLAELKRETDNATTQYRNLTAGLETNRTKMRDSRGETDNLRSAVGKLPSRTDLDFRTNVKETIGVIREATRSMGVAVAEMIERVFNRGIIGPWNYISDKLGLGRGFGELDVKGYLKGFHAGGYTGDGNKYDEAGIVHAGEWVTTKEKTARYRPLLEAMHRGDDAQVAKGYAGGGHVHGVHCMPGYANGGQVTYPQLNAIRAQLFPGTVTTSSIRNSNDNHGKGWAIDIGVPGNSPSQLIPIAQKLAALYPHATEMINKTGASIKNGQQVPPSFWGQATWNQHGNHVHWAMSPDALARGAAAGSDMEMLNNPIAYLAKQGAEAIKGINNPVMFDQIQAIAKMALSSALDSEKNIINAANGAITKPGPTRTSGNADIVRAIAAKRGWDQEPQWGSLYSLVQKESSFNNLAQNPTSTAYGLFQFLNSTWAGTGYKKTSDPSIQTEAGLKYIQQRYGTPVGAWNFHKKNNWYAAGGVFDRATDIRVGEGGPETVLPLNSTGAEFVGRTIQATLRQMNMGQTVQDMRRQRTGSYATPQQATQSFSTTDNSTTYTGDITVQASDPNEMQRQLDARKRAAALTRPMARR